MNENTLRRYEAAIAKIGHPALLELPEGIILEAVAEAMKK